MKPKYPFAPLARAMGLTESQACKALGLSGRTEQEYRRDGVSEKVADRLAVKAHMVAANIWPELVDRAIEEHRAAQRAAKAKAMRKWRAKPAGKEASLRQNTRYYQETRDYQLRRYQERYWSDPERHRAERRERYARQKAS